MTIGDNWTLETRPTGPLSAEDLGLIVPVRAEHGSNRADESQLESDHPLLLAVRESLSMFGGVIFTGPPGTSKSYYASKIAYALVDGDEDRVRHVQFHPSYQYEDFMQGFVPKQDATGFELKDRVFLDLCRKAEQDSDQRLWVLVIDELSRGDTGRIFGEALTYVEHSKRTLPFELPSGETRNVPRNLVLLATMNPQDRGVDEVDAAFERRFAKIALDPDVDRLREMLTSNGVEATLQAHLVGWFLRINGLARQTPQAAVGHAYFSTVVDAVSLQKVWDYQLRFHVERAFRLDPEARSQVETGWKRIFLGLPTEDDAEAGQTAREGEAPATAVEDDAAQAEEPSV